VFGGKALAGKSDEALHRLPAMGQELVDALGGMVLPRANELLGVKVVGPSGRVGPAVGDQIVDGR
jgi:hypothetical protein